MKNSITKQGHRRNVNIRWREASPAFRRDGGGRMTQSSANFYMFLEGTEFGGLNLLRLTCKVFQRIKRPNIN